MSEKVQCNCPVETATLSKAMVNSSVLDSVTLHAKDPM